MLKPNYAMQRSAFVVTPLAGTAGGPRRVHSASGATPARSAARSTRTLYGLIQVVTIRKATQEDRVGIYNVHRTAALQMEVGYYMAVELEAWLAHLSPDLYEQPIATQEFVVAEVDGAVVGFGQLNLGTGVVKAVYVSPDRAGKGLGASILNTLEGSARAAGVERLRLDASLNSVGFYERMGYMAERPGVHRTLGGQEIRCVHMRKDLVPWVNSRITMRWGV